MRCMDGICQKYFSYSDGERLPLLPDQTELGLEDHFMCSSGVAFDNFDTVSSKMVDKYFGTCGITVKSLQKGEECDDETMCET